jgi:hypothetical protein
MSFAVLSLLTGPATRDLLSMMPILLGLAACMPFIFHLRFRFPILDPCLAVLAAPSLHTIPKALDSAAALSLRYSKR